MLSQFNISIFFYPRYGMNIYLSLRSIYTYFPFFLPRVIHPNPYFLSRATRYINIVFSIRGAGQNKYSGEETFTEEEEGEAGFSSGSVSLDGDEGSHDGHHPTLRPHFSWAHSDIFPDFEKINKIYEFLNVYSDPITEFQVQQTGIQWCINHVTCSHPELTQDHVLTSAYVIIFWTVATNGVNKSVWRKKDCSWLPSTNMQWISLLKHQQM